MFYFNPKFDGDFNKLETYLDSYPLSYIKKYENEMINSISDINTDFILDFSSTHHDIVIHSSDLGLDSQPSNNCPFIDSGISILKDEIRNCEDKIEELEMESRDELSEMENELEELEENKINIIEEKDNLIEQYESQDEDVEDQDLITPDEYEEKLDELETQLSYLEDDILIKEREISEFDSTDNEYSDKIADISDTIEERERAIDEAEELRSMSSSLRDLGSQARDAFFDLVTYVSISYLSDKKYLVFNIDEDIAHAQDIYNKEGDLYPNGYEYAFEEAVEQKDDIFKWAIQFTREDSVESLKEYLEYHDSFLMIDEYKEYVRVFFQEYISTRNSSEININTAA